MILYILIYYSEVICVKFLEIEFRFEFFAFKNDFHLFFFICFFIILIKLEQIFTVLLFFEITGCGFWRFVWCIINIIIVLLLLFLLFCLGCENEEGGRDFILKDFDDVFGFLAVFPVFYEEFCVFFLFVA